jgi:hypothetical protein
MTVAQADRRAWPRFGLRADRPAHSVGKLLPGRNIRVINISRGGVLFESEDRLRPGASAELQLGAGEARRLVRGMVVRCWVSGLRAGNVRYRAALAFPMAVDLDEGIWCANG